MPKTKPMSDALLEAVALRFRALAEPARLRILQQLMSHERSVNELTEATGLSQANTSKHLATLHAAGLVERRKEGTQVYYLTADPVVKELCDLVCTRITAQVRASSRAMRAK